MLAAVRVAGGYRSVRATVKWIEVEDTHILNVASLTRLPGATGASDTVDLGAKLATGA